MIEQKQTLMSRASSAAMILSCRMTRGGPRLAAGMAVALMVTTAYLTGFTASQETISTFTKPLYNKWQSMGPDGQVGGGLRIVVFGTPDVAGVGGFHLAEDEKPWTEKLCDTVQCSEFISYIPHVNSTDLESVDAALTSNNLWKNAIKHVNGPDFDSSKPGFNYDWVDDLYPVPSHPDLVDQVTSFIATEQPAALPKETLWVFNFGTWDIWYLAALPRDVATHYVDSLVIRLFSQIEFLYQESLNERSVAYSAFWNYASPELLAKARDPESKLKETEVEAFRVLIPKLFDISITPGWKNARPVAPAPHNKAEQERNALFLTDRWNEMVAKHSERWQRQFNPSTEKEYEEMVEKVSDAEPMGAYLQAAAQQDKNKSKKPVLGSKHSRDIKKPVSRVRQILADLDARDSVQLARQAEAPSGVSASAKIQKRWRHTTHSTADSAPVVGPFPRRVATQFDGSVYINEAMIEQQFRKANISDHLGRGVRNDDDIYVYDEAWKTCVEGEMRAVHDGIQVCSNPEDYLFESLFTVGQRARTAIAEVAGQAAYDILKLGKPSEFSHGGETVVDHGDEKAEESVEEVPMEEEKSVEEKPVEVKKDETQGETTQSASENSQ